MSEAKRKVTASAGTFVRLEIKGETGSYTPPHPLLGPLPTCPVDNGECQRFLEWLASNRMYYHTFYSTNGHVILLIPAEYWETVSHWLKINGIDVPV